MPTDESEEEDAGRQWYWCDGRWLYKDWYAGSIHSEESAEGEHMLTDVSEGEDSADADVWRQWRFCEGRWLYRDWYAGSAHCEEWSEEDSTDHDPGASMCGEYGRSRYGDGWHG